MPIDRRPLLSLAMVLLLLAPTVQAHRLRVFATTDGPWIQGQAYFGGGRAAVEVRILIYDDQHLVAELAPDAQGEFRWRAEAPATYRIVAKTADGHRGEWTIAATELTGAFALSNHHSKDDPPPSAAAEHQRPANPDPAVSPTRVPSEPGCTDAALDARIEQALARQLQPVREQLSRAEDRLLLRDLLGGIGWIFGLAGLALWWRRRVGR